MLVQDGATGQRGNVQVARAIPGSVWSDSEAVLAISGASYGVPQNRDIVTLYNNAANFSQAKYYDGSAWQALAAYFPGGVIVDGTVDATALKARTITADKIAAGAITASSLSVTTAGTGLNRDPNFQDFYNSWTINPTWPNVSYGVQPGGAAPANTYAYSPSGLSGVITTNEMIPIDSSRTYTQSCSAYTDGGNNRFLLLFVQFFNAAGALITNTGWGDSNFSGFTQSIMPTAGDWYPYRSGLFGANAGNNRTIPASAKYCKIGAFLNNVGSSNTLMAVTALKVEEVVPGVLIQNGAITADKINVNNLQAVAVYLGNIQLGPNGSLRQGSTGFGVGNGVYLGADGNGNPVFSLVAGSKKVLFDPANNIARVENFDVVNPQMTLSGVPATINGGSGLPNDTAWRVYGSFTVSVTNGQGTVTVNGFINVTEGEMRLSQSGNTFTVSGRGTGGAGGTAGRSNSATVVITATDTSNKFASAQTVAFGSHGIIQ